ncbi:MULTISPECIES: hypothetical protein [unclassified Amycolatopsis]|uniref:hypothetical protein n=1 Tax=unclassified Amycolatopsis TaxID=2618356 RepID=UPI00106E53A7|nr:MULTISPECIES: hypothetical protein [unclassified Amycolatopsis]
MGKRAFVGEVDRSGQLPQWVFDGWQNKPVRSPEERVYAYREYNRRLGVLSVDLGITQRELRDRIHQDDRYRAPG